MGGHGSFLRFSPQNPRTACRPGVKTVFSKTTTAFMSGIILDAKVGIYPFQLSHYWDFISYTDGSNPGSRKPGAVAKIFDSACDTDRYR